MPYDNASALARRVHRVQGGNDCLHSRLERQGLGFHVSIRCAQDAGNFHVLGECRETRHAPEASDVGGVLGIETLHHHRVPFAHALQLRRQASNGVVVNRRVDERNWRGALGYWRPSVEAQGCGTWSRTGRGAFREL